MKYRLVVCGVDLVEDGVLLASHGAVPGGGNIDADALCSMREEWADREYERLKQWIERRSDINTEFLELEIDTEANTCVVVPA